MRRICDLCGSSDAIVTSSSGKAMCEGCLERFIIRRSFAELEASISDGDLVVVALSGGKDSSLALWCVYKYRELSSVEFSLKAVTVDEGSPYRRPAIEAARSLCRELGVEHVLVNMKDYQGISVSDLLHLRRLPNRRRSICTYCGVLRRQTLNMVARELGADKVITGHNLDDVIQTFFMNMVRGDVNALARFLSRASPIRELIPRVRPLLMIREKEIAAFVIARGITAHVGKCPMARGMRIRVRRALDELEVSSRGFKSKTLPNVIAILDKARFNLSKRLSLYICEKCGEPSAEKICKACQLKMELKDLA